MFLQVLFYLKVCTIPVTPIVVQTGLEPARALNAPNKDVYQFHHCTPGMTGFNQSTSTTDRFILSSVPLRTLPELFYLLEWQVVSTCCLSNRSTCSYWSRKRICSGLVIRYNRALKKIFLPKLNLRLFYTHRLNIST